MQKKSSNTLLKISLSFSIFIIISFSVYLGISPIFKIRVLKKIVSSDSIYLEKYNQAFESAELTPSIRLKDYRNAQLELSSSDSIQLILNLNDSLIYLSIKGVPIHTTKIEQFKIDGVLSKLPNQMYSKLFSKPVNVIKEKSTIIKEPVVVRHAPKDTIEAALNAYTPDTLIQKPAFLSLQLDHNIMVVFEQESNPRFIDKWLKCNFKLKAQFENAIQNINFFVRLKKPQYKPSIRIKLPADDLRVIYRALPTNKSIVISFSK